MPKTLFVSDLDGTLLGADARLSTSTVKLLNEAIHAGALFTVATARTPATVDILMHDVDMRLPAIVMTGAALWSFDTRQYSDPHFIPHEDLLKTLKLFDSFGVYPFIYTLKDERASELQVYYANPHPSSVDENFIAQRSNLPLKRFIRPLTPRQLPEVSEARTLSALVDICPLFEQEHTSPHTLLLFASGAKETLSALQTALNSQIPNLAVSCYDDIYNPGVSLIEVFAAGVSKANAILNLSRQLDIERVVAFGDSQNDLPMFAVADQSIAVANASPIVLETAETIIESNTTDSVARYILNNLQ